MQLNYVGLRNGLIFALGSAAFAACGGGSDNASASNTSVEAAYGALVSDVAHCAKQVDTCLGAAGTDNAALDQCRAQFTSCRDSAGSKAEGSVAAAVTTCTSQHQECAKGMKGTDAGVSECRSELRSCLADATPRHDGGAQGAASGVKDCLEDLRSCVEQDGKASECAHTLRSCVVDALPSVDVVTPKHGDDGDDEDKDAGVDEDHGDKRGDGGKPMMSGKPADAGGGKNRSDEARKCVASFSSCVESAGTPQSCVSALKDCKSSVEP